MSSTVVDGLVLPVAVAGHPALDFCNTRAGWGSAAQREYLCSFEHLVVWAREAGLLQPAGVERLIGDAAKDPEGAGTVLDAAVRLREVAYRVALGSGSAADFEVVATHAQAARSSSTLHPRGGRPGPTSNWVLPDDGLDAALLAVGAAMGDLLCSPLSGVVAACPGGGCGWLFADPRQRRRWCDMAVCGNRAKARRHAARLAAGRR